jgi:hypothetical protein
VAIGNIINLKIASVAHINFSTDMAAGLAKVLISPPHRVTTGNAITLKKYTAASIKAVL